MLIDLRSDTVTLPTKEMMNAMLQARVGDDVFEEDPTVNELEAMVANMFNKEAAIYCPSGTMSNQIAIKCHTQPGDEVICDKNSHIYLYEGGGIAFNAGVQVKLIEGNLGRINAEQVQVAINPDDVHKPKTVLVSLENTCNRGGGSCYNFEEIKKIKNICIENEMALHLDGARLFNALIAKKETTQQYGAVFNTISICLNKGLGCPIGSLLLGDKQFIKKARRIRKIFGGGLRQVGFMAACGIYALQNHVHRLAQDHAAAKQIENALREKNCIGEILPVETNIIIFEILQPYTAKTLVQYFVQKNIQCIAISPSQIRMVTHLNITEKQVNEIVFCIKSL